MADLQEFFESLLTIFASVVDFFKSVFGIEETPAE
jgi:hypothetical protein